MKLFEIWYTKTVDDGPFKVTGSIEDCMKYIVNISRENYSVIDIVPVGLDELEKSGEEALRAGMLQDMIDLVMFCVFMGCKL